MIFFDIFCHTFCIWEYDMNELGSNLYIKVFLSMGRPNNGNVAGNTCRRKCNNGNVGGETGLRRCDCECVYECLFELLAEAVEDHHDCWHPCHERPGSVRPGGGTRNRCECVYECLLALLREALD